VLAIIGGIGWLASKASEKATEGKPNDPQR
jgi:hypothetical protein